MNQNTFEIKQNSVKAWLMAARPKTLTGAAVPVMIGVSLAYSDTYAGLFLMVPAILCFCFAFVMQIDANFINDYFDFVKGNDDETRLGPRRACAQGWVSVGAMKYAIGITTVIGCIIGMPLIYYGGLEMILIGLLCVIFCFLYTTHLSYLGLGDALVIVFFGIVPVCVTFYIQKMTVDMETFVASIACGLVIDTLLIVNNYRDIDNDKRAGKNTLVVKLGPLMSRGLYLWMGFLSCILGLVFVIFGHHLFAFILPLIYAAIHYTTYRKLVRINKGKALNLVLGDTARNIFIYGLCVSVGVLLG
jgi:1,4-dihydroxy-2-naphthoate octaprenyltransferase